MTWLRWFLWLCVAWPCAAQTPPKVWRLDRAAPAVNPSLRGLQFAVLTATQTRQDLILRVGIFNGNAESASGSAALRSEDVSLSAMTEGQVIKSQPTTITLTDLFGSGTNALAEFC